MAVTQLQVTLSGATQVSSTKILARWVVFANNAAAVMGLGDASVSTTHGILLQAAGSMFCPPTCDISQIHDLSQWYVKGTDAQILDVIFDKVGS